MRKREHFAFLDGYKPALLISPRNQHFETIVATNFPHVVPFDDEAGSHMFFQTEEQKEDYLKRMEGVGLRSYEFNMIVGEVLGFPVRSVEYFSKMRVLEDKIGYYPEEEEQTKVGVAWAGFFFSSHIEFVEQEIHWLFDTYQHEKAVGLPLYLRTLEDGYIEIPYGDFAKLQLVVQAIRERRNQKTSATA
jgi:hypothetical protein